MTEGLIAPFWKKRDSKMKAVEKAGAIDNNGFLELDVSWSEKFPETVARSPFWQFQKTRTSGGVFLTARKPGTLASSGEKAMMDSDTEKRIELIKKITDNRIEKELREKLLRKEEELLNLALPEQKSDTANSRYLDDTFLVDASNKPSTIEDSSLPELADMAQSRARIGGAETLRSTVGQVPINLSARILPRDLAWCEDAIVHSEKRERWNWENTGSYAMSFHGVKVDKIDRWTKRMWPGIENGRCWAKKKVIVQNGERSERENLENVWI